MTDDDRSAQVSALATLEALQWLGTPYRHQASVRGVGADCLGLVRGVYRSLGGKETEPLPAYGRRPTKQEEQLLPAAQRYLEEAEKVQPGTVLLFRMRRSLPISHCGIAIAHDRFVHAYDGQRVLSAPLSEFWRSRIAALFCFPDFL